MLLAWSLTCPGVSCYLMKLIQDALQRMRLKTAEVGEDVLLKLIVTKCTVPTLILHF